MRVLLDTHVLLWAVGVSTRLSPDTHATLRNGATQVYFSSTSIWKIAIKQNLNEETSTFAPIRLRPLRWKPVSWSCHFAGRLRPPWPCCHSITAIRSIACLSRRPSRSI